MCKNGTQNNVLKKMILLFLLVFFFDKKTNLRDPHLVEEEVEEG